MNTYRHVVARAGVQETSTLALPRQRSRCWIVPPHPKKLCRVRVRMPRNLSARPVHPPTTLGQSPLSVPATVSHPPLAPRPPRGRLPPSARCSSTAQACCEQRDAQVRPRWPKACTLLFAAPGHLAACLAACPVFIARMPQHQAGVASACAACLVAVLQSGSPEVQNAAAWLIYNMATAGGDSLVAAGVIPPLMQLLRSGREDLEDAARAVQALARHRLHAHAAIATAGGIPALTALLRSQLWRVRIAAASALDALLCHSSRLRSMAAEAAPSRRSSACWPASRGFSSDQRPRSCAASLQTAQNAPLLLPRCQVRCPPWRPCCAAARRRVQGTHCPWHRCTTQRRLQSTQPLCAPPLQPTPRFTAASRLSSSHPWWPCSGTAATLIL